MIRVFIAIDLPAEVCAALGEAQAKLKQTLAGVKLSWTKINNLHLTLQFLGNVAEETIPGMSKSLVTVAGKFEPFNIVVSGAGAFPNEHKPHVLWVGCDDSAGKLRALTKTVQEAMMAFGFEPEHRKFAAHLTLGRVKVPRPDAALTKALGSIKQSAFGAMRVEAIHLFQSQLHPDGSVYTKLSSHNLRGDTNHGGKS